MELPTEIRRAYRVTTEKHRAIAYYCPWCKTLIEAGLVWDAKKSLALHTSDRGVWASCPAVKTQSSGRRVINWGNWHRFGMFMLERRARGCGKELGSEVIEGRGWYAFCLPCAKSLPRRMGEEIVRGRLSMGRVECGDAPGTAIYVA